MKRSHIALAGMAVLVLAAATLVWFLPARWALPWVQPRLHGLHLDQVEGSVWKGRAGSVSFGQGMATGSLAWTLSRRALLGDVRLGLDLRYPQWQAQGQMRRVSASRSEWRDVSIRLDAAALGVQPSLHAQPQGWIDLHITQAQLQGGWPMRIDATGQWPQAAVRTAQGTIPLGGMSLVISGHDGVLRAVLGDDGDGPLQTAGRLSLSPLGWQLGVTLKPRDDDPTLRRWLGTFGHPAADGTLRLSYRGGLVTSSTGKQ